MRPYRSLAFFVFLLFLPVALIGIAEAVKPTMPVDELAAGVVKLKADVPALPAEMKRPIGHVRWPQELSAFAWVGFNVGEFSGCPGEQAVRPAGIPTVPSK